MCAIIHFISFDLSCPVLCGIISYGSSFSSALASFSAQRLDLFAWCVRLSRLFERTFLKSLHFYSSIRLLSFFYSSCKA